MAHFDEYTLYAWTGINKMGVEVKGMVPAENETNATAHLVAQGIEVRSLKAKPRWLVRGQLKDPKLADIVIVMRQLTTMISAGIPLVSSIEIIANGVEKISVRLMLMDIYRSVSGGTTFAEALAKYPKQFNKLACSLISAGEQSGTLDIILDQVATYMERIQILRMRIKKAMFYPVIMLVVTLSVAVLLLGFIVPQFEGLFKSFGAQLPFPTRVVMSISKFLGSKWWLLIGLFIAGIFGYSYGKRTSRAFRYFLDRLALNMPVFGALIRGSILARISRTLAITLAAGIPLVDALKNSSEIANNRLFRDAILKIREDVISGKPLVLSMSLHSMFPPMMLQMIGVGEKSGAMEKMLRKLAEFYDEQVSTMVDGLSTLLEPVLLIILGLVIGGFVVAMYLPIFRLGTVM